MNRSLACLLVAVCLLPVLVETAEAWDGYRRGFFLGFGAGPGFTSYTDTEGGIKSSRQSQTTICTDLRLGMGLNDVLLLSWTNRVSWIKPMDETGERETVGHGVTVIGMSAFMKRRAPSPYVTLGVGYSLWGTPFEKAARVRYGFGFSAGAGYEFTSHMSLEGNFLWGRPKGEVSGADLETNVLTAEVTLNLLFY